MAIPNYEVYALRYAWRPAKRADHFLGGDPDPETPMPMDYFVWVARNAENTLLIDTGFKEDVGNRRGRTYLRKPVDALRMIDIEASSIQDIAITHMHYDHAGTIDAFPNARVHLQDLEMRFVTGRDNARSRGAFEADDVTEVVRRLYGDRLCLYDGSATLWPGINIHLLGGHTPGMQVVQVHTQRGWVVLAADASHFYENMESGRPFSATYDVDKCLAGFETLRGLADSPQHVVPGHDPEVVKRYPAPSRELEGIAVRLDAAPAS